MQRILIFLLLCFLATGGQALGQPKAPSEIGGFALGESISAYKDRLDMNSARPLPDAPFLMRVNIKPFQGFSSGYLLYGTCDKPGRVARIKLRYADSGIYILTEINSSLMERYGQPEEIRDNHDRSYICNKWSLTGDGGQAISLILQRYDGWDPEYDRGSSIKLADWTLLDAEKACSLKKEPPGTAAPTKSAKADASLLPK
jgi:hypothetical protein